jgi:hypothetical protein
MRRIQSLAGFRTFGEGKFIVAAMRGLPSSSLLWRFGVGAKRRPMSTGLKESWIASSLTLLAMKA